VRSLSSGILHAEAGPELASAADQAESIGGFVGVDDVPNSVLVLALPWPRRRVEA
jgi:hypothetical protein